MPIPKLHQSRHYGHIPEGERLSPKERKKQLIKTIATAAGVGAVLLFIIGTITVAWVSRDLPDPNKLSDRQISQSTKIYDRTGEHMLFEVYQNQKRTLVEMDQIANYAKKATIAVEDKDFYTHSGIRIQSILRAGFNNLIGRKSGSGGASTLTQQLIKNTIVGDEHSIFRKVKEAILALRLEKKYDKEQILKLYLNEIPYGSTNYGIEAASQAYFHKNAKDLTLAESATLAAIPKAPSKYLRDLDALRNRRDLVLALMFNQGYINEEQKKEAQGVALRIFKNFGPIEAPHFVFYVQKLLADQFGERAIDEGGLKVITTLDFDKQQIAEKAIKELGDKNAKDANANNAALVAMDPKTKQILALVGSRDYNNDDIDGKYDVATQGNRQPGSSFKPFVYTYAFEKGYTPETVVFDLPTEFSTTCYSGGNCYKPQNYDEKFRGPISLRNALSQSLNIPAVKVLYLAGIEDALTLAKRMGLETLTNPKQYGLTLVLGGGEVRPLDMAGAYAVFAADGIKNPINGILKVEDNKGKKLEEFQKKEYRVLPEQTARLISSVLSDNSARTPAFGANSPLFFGDIDVAAKTGTTNDYRDTWIVGYTPNISVVAWAGNNDNRSMQKQTAGFIVAPMWNEFMQKAIAKYPASSFIDPTPINPYIKPILRGVWENPSGIHEILHWVTKSNPTGPEPTNPASDPQYILWEEPVQKWLQGETFESKSSESTFKIINPENGKTYLSSTEIFIAATITGTQITSSKIFLNGKELGQLSLEENTYSFIPDNEPLSKKGKNEIKIEITDSNNTIHTDTVLFSIK